MTDSPLRWGILGTGGIASVFTEDVRRLPGHEVAAVGSRSHGTAAAFAERYGVPRAHGSYAELAADDGVDVVYVATPHPLHYEPACQCIEAGRAVLVEKPFTTGAADAEKLAALARERGVFAMEAMWTRFNPLVRRLRDLVAGGAIGDVTAVYADFSITRTYDPEHRLWSPELGGGALLDLGCYPLSFTWPLLGPPASVQATASPAPTGVDANTGVLLGYASGAVALLHCGLLGDSPHTATVIGTRGRVDVASPFYRPASMTVVRTGGDPEVLTADIEGHGYTYQAEEVARCLRAGLTESPLMPLDETVAILRTIDEITAQFGQSTSTQP
ncbi:scyllo-inositol 2-dehydrogenase (NADP(+)) IolU [Actinomadura sp. RB99]|uniref:Gfo/Idh/MocA family protein n=1 Tax=Actinomadura sp. RB99 TaxID=2691577 RepID=UPI0016860AB5|nr:Gfo/Idh/MocA family oxidoreductase [Actinomadura sp. RB99]MBD2899956.1 scyllo-inositol 2-dehydrogenase (NADP(+)) IolU [Actinomadura sp. RB99]